eukprot:Lankesteria_metandrocarpae@DN6146_c0_g1_i1.p1
MEGRPPLDGVPTRKRRLPSGGALSSEARAAETALRKLKVSKTTAAPTVQGVTAFAATAIQGRAARGSSGTPMTRYLIAVGSGLKVEFREVRDVLDIDQARVKTYSRFNAVVRCLTYRSDGELVATADDSGTVQVVHINTMNPLRVYKEHLGPVHACSFSSDKLRITSAGDDGSLKLWDIGESSSSILDIQNAHNDYIRALTAHPRGKLVWATGSFDGTAKIWDLTAAVKSDSETNASSDTGDTYTGTDRTKVNWLRMTIRHHKTHGVTGVAFFDDGTKLVTAGGHQVKIWDISQGEPVLVNKLRCHMKSITGVALSWDNKMVISSSVDESVKFTDVGDGSSRKVFHFGTPVQSVFILSNGLDFVVSLSNGKWVLRQRREETKPRSIATTDGTQLLNPLYRSGKFWFRGASAMPSAKDTLVVTAPSASPVVKRSKKLDRLVASFQYREALNEVLCSGTGTDGGNRDEGVHSLIEELLCRGGLELSCRGMDEESIMNPLRFVESSIGAGPGFIRAMEFAGVLFAENGWLASATCPKLRSTLDRVSSKITKELYCIKQFEQLSAVLNLHLVS